MIKKLEEYQDETQRNRRKQQRRRERLEAAAKANGYDSWYKMVTAMLTAADSGEDFTVKAPK